MRKWSEMSSHQRSESIHPAKAIAALNAQIDNLEMEYLKLRNPDVGMRMTFSNHMRYLKKRLKQQKEELEKCGKW